MSGNLLLVLLFRYFAILRWHGVETVRLEVAPGAMGTMRYIFIGQVVGSA